MTQPPSLDGIRAILFDKDGTLFDFQATWGTWAHGFLHREAGEDPALLERLAEVLQFDLPTRRFRPLSPVIAGTGREVAELIAPLLGRPPETLETMIVQSSAEVPPSEAVPLAPLLARLRAAGLTLGVATNDYESVAHRHLGTHAAAFHTIFGFDSGHGGKPAPGMLLAFARAHALAPAEVLMVGDSRHDLAAGRAAGMATLGVLTGVAVAADLADLADYTRPDIGHLPALLGLD